MTTHFVKPPAGVDPGPKPSPADLAAFETASGRRLPGDYKLFMQRYNGGHVYPLDFLSGYPNAHPIFDEYDEPIALERIDTWQEVVQSQSLRHLWDMSRFIQIGDAIGGTLLLECTGANAGAVHLWWRNNNPDEPVEGMPVTGVVAPSFREFIESSLHEAGESDSRWDLPNSFDNAVPISFDPDPDEA